MLFSFWQGLGFGCCFLLFELKIEKKVLGKFWVLMAAFFYPNPNSKSIGKIDFLTFWQSLGFDSCFLFKFYLQSLGN